MEFIQSVNNPRVKRAVKLLNSSRERRKEQRFVLEGLRLCMDVVRSGLTAEELYVTEELMAREPEKINELAAVTESVFLMSRPVAEKLTDTRNPQGICCILPKALRASMGALLRLSVLETGDITGTIENAKKNGMKTYASVPDSRAVSVTDTDFSGGAIVVVGNEANGVTEETLASCQGTVTIPMAGRAESLNAGAAASILMWEMVRPYENKTEK